MKINDENRSFYTLCGSIIKIIFAVAIFAVLISIAISIVLVVQTGKLNRIYGVDKSFIEV